MENEKTITDRIRGSIVLGAFGDAFGYPIEFLHGNGIKNDYGSDHFCDHVPPNRLFLFSDDTQMSLLAANAIICAWTRYSDRGICSPAHIYAYHMYRRWAHMMRGWDCPKDDAYSRSWLLEDIPPISADRDPGLTCMRQLLSDMEMGTVEKRCNDSKGCGGVMRAAPYGMKESLHDYIKEAVDDAASTHGHPLGWLSAGLLAGIVHHSIFSSCGLKESVERTMRELEEKYHQYPELGELQVTVDKAFTLAEDGIRDISRLGEGWVGEEAVSMAIYACLSANDVKDMLRLATMHDGDSDSVGSIAGNIWGAIHGFDSFKDKLHLGNLECFGTIMQIADDLSLEDQSAAIKTPEWKNRYYHFD